MKLLGDILVGAKAITPAMRDKALAQRSKLKGRIGTALLEVGGAPEPLLLRALSVQRQVPPASAEDLSAIRPDILRLVPSKLAAKLNVVPFKRVGRNVFLAMRDPQDLPAVDEISFLTGLPITPHVALEARLYQSLFDHYGIETQPRYMELCKKLDAMKEQAGRPEAPAASPSAPAPVPPPPPPIFDRRAADTSPGPRSRRAG
ncbi:MAG TPA: hypothetical protein VGR00_05310, partial [Thermoanaerobaculia bacterium]|nr:hypothetical protein [Thermoanaerobaculia bacterium]